MNRCTSYVGVVSGGKQMTLRRRDQRNGVVKKTFVFLVQYIKFHEVDLANISQFQYKHEGGTYEIVFDQVTLS